MAALVAAALAHVGERPAWLAATLADRYRAPGTVVAAALLALVGASAVAVVLGMLIAPRLTPEARQLMLALALALQGGGAVWRVKPPPAMSGWRFGAFATATVGLFALLMASGVQFVVLALAARTAVPALAGVGAVAGAMAVLATAATLGERGWTRLPLVLARRVIGGLFVFAGLWIGLGAVKLV